MTTSNCVIDANFIVKLVSVGMDDILEEWKTNGWITDQADEDRRSQAIEVLDGLNILNFTSYMWIFRGFALSRPRVLKKSSSIKNEDD